MAQFDTELNEHLFSLQLFSLLAKLFNACNTFAQESGAAALARSGPHLAHFDPIAIRQVFFLYLNNSDTISYTHAVFTAKYVDVLYYVCININGAITTC